MTGNDGSQPEPKIAGHIACARVVAGQPAVKTVSGVQADSPPLPGRRDCANAG